MTIFMTSRTATLIGLTAILMWSLLAVMTVETGRVPAFQLAAMTFAIGGLAGCASWLVRPEGARALRQPLVQKRDRFRIVIASRLVLAFA